MYRRLLLIVLSCMTASCGYFEVKPRDSELGPVIARAFFSSRACVGVKGQSETLSAADLLGFGITKGVELAVGYVTDAVAAAAKADKDTVTITGQNPDYLFSVQTEKAKMRGCLFVVVAPQVSHGRFCNVPQGEEGGNWYNSATCKSGVAAELVDKWEEWSLGAPTFFAEIAFLQPKGGPANAVIPKVHKLYYPAPVSTMSEDKVKGFSILVTAASPTKSTRTSGDVIMEVFMGGDGVTPVTARNNALQTSGLWVVVPPLTSAMGNDFAGPVNLTVTVAETPHATAWLQAVAGYVAENKQKGIDLAVSRLDPVAVAKADAAEAATASAYRINAATLCTTLSTEIDKVTQVHAIFAKGEGGREEQLRAGYALDSACEVASNAGKAAIDGWTLAGYKEPACRRPDVGHEVDGLCLSR